MASFNPRQLDDGYATPAAAVISIALAVIASATTIASVELLKQQRAALRQQAAEYALEAAQAQAAVRLLNDGAEGREVWAARFGDADFEVVAEPEAPKLGLARAAQLTDAELARWRVRRTAELRTALAKLSNAKGPTANFIAEAGSSPEWRLCARSSISPYGTADHLSDAARSSGGASASVGRTGQLWRVRIAAETGWVDDRVIRFIGASEHPIAIAADRFGRGGQMGASCG